MSADDGMPFSYLNQTTTSQDDDNTLFYPESQSGHWFPSTSPFNPAPVQFQLPQFMQNGPPMLAPGGGAEVLPVALFNSSRHHGMPSWTNMKSHPSDKLLQKTSTIANEVNTVHQPLPVEPVDATGSPFGPLNLPLYSASGFDMMSVLSRVFTRPNPQVSLGPVDFTSSFCVVDPKRFDNPMIYCSPSFCTLTGYSESEILGRNCRFLQAPPLVEVQRGSTRQYTDQKQVDTLAKAVAAGKECQVSMMNFRKDGSAFMNLVTVIPVRFDAENLDSEIVYHVGFQVDLTKQPNAILERLTTGRYILDTTFPKHGASISPKDPKRLPVPPSAISQDLQQLLTDPGFLSSISLDPAVDTPSMTSFLNPTSSNSTQNDSSSHPLSSLLLSVNPDFIHVLSLKGSFLYCSPSVTNVLGYEGTELVGKSLTDICHPADLVGVLRELKEGATASGTSEESSRSPDRQRAICLLFRALTKSSQKTEQGSGLTGQYIWLECRGRLYSEPGKGRKAIILSGRARSMWCLDWSDVQGLGVAIPSPNMALGKRKRSVEGKESGRSLHREFWGLLSTLGVLLSVGEEIRDVVGWEQADVLGISLLTLLANKSSDDCYTQSETITAITMALKRLSSPPVTEDRSNSMQILCGLRKRDGSIVDVRLAIYRSSQIPSPEFNDLGDISYQSGVCVAPLVLQVRLADVLPDSRTVSTGQIFAPLLSSPRPSASFNSSWQYEIQQVRFENAKMAEEVENLEETLASICRNETVREATTIQLRSNGHNVEEVSEGESVVQSEDRLHDGGFSTRLPTSQDPLSSDTKFQSQPTFVTPGYGNSVPVSMRVSANRVSGQLTAIAPLPTPSTLSISATLSSIRAFRAGQHTGHITNDSSECGSPSVPLYSHGLPLSTYTHSPHQSSVPFQPTHPLNSPHPEPSADWQAFRRTNLQYLQNQLGILNRSSNHSDRVQNCPTFLSDSSLN